VEGGKSPQEPRRRNTEWLTKSRKKEKKKKLFANWGARKGQVEDPRGENWGRKKQKEKVNGGWNRN